MKLLKNKVVNEGKSTGHCNAKEALNMLHLLPQCCITFAVTNFLLFLLSLVLHLLLLKASSTIYQLIPTMQTPNLPFNTSMPTSVSDHNHYYNLCIAQLK